MTEHDKQLIEEGERTPPGFSWKILDLLEQAESEEAKDILNRRFNRLYHSEEAYAGID